MRDERRRSPVMSDIGLAVLYTFRVIVSDYLWNVAERRASVLQSWQEPPGHTGVVGAPRVPVILTAA